MGVCMEGVGNFERKRDKYIIYLQLEKLLCICLSSRLKNRTFLFFWSPLVFDDLMLSTQRDEFLEMDLKGI